MQEINMAALYTLNEQIFANTNNAAHGTKVPANARLLFSNGQVGQRFDGSIPDPPAEQLEVISNVSVSFSKPRICHSMR